MEIDGNRFTIWNYQGVTAAPMRICDVVKVDHSLFVEVKRNKKLFHMPLNDFLYALKNAQKKLTDPKKDLKK